MPRFLNAAEPREEVRRCCEITLVSREEKTTMKFVNPYCPTFCIAARAMLRRS